LLAWRDICRATDARTCISAILPFSAAGDTVLIFAGQLSAEDKLKLVAELNCFAKDYATRQKIGGTHLKYHYFRQLPAVQKDSAPQWITNHAKELCTTDAKSAAVFQHVYRFDPSRRFQIRCELDAAFFHLYGIERDDVDYIMETFPIVKRKDVAKYGTYRTKERILTIYDEMAACIAAGTEWVSPLDPPPGDPRAAWTEEEMEMWRQGKGDELIAKYNLLDDADTDTDTEDLADSDPDPDDLEAALSESDEPTEGA
jgi:hypothetical protein